MTSETTINTVTGPIPLSKLGRTLMHEHLAVGFPGWELDTLSRGPAFDELVSKCVDKVQELQAAGYSTLVDPCPNDMGRDVTLMQEVARRTGFNIVCATGFYHSDLGASGYWKVRARLDPGGAERIAELFVKELTAGVGDTGVRPGILKVATENAITDYEQTMLSAAAKASIATGVPITTHTNAVLGDQQVDRLAAAGVAAHRIIVGHSCGSNDHDYHRAILDRGAYIGFDRFGLNDINSDANRAASLARLIQAGFTRRIVVSHDCVLCLRGMERLWEERTPSPGMLRFDREIAPMLRDMGVSQGDIDRLTRDNPLNYFAGTA